MFESTWPRVVRSPEVGDNQAFIIGGDCFKDGLRRVIVGYGITPDQVAELTAAIEDRERVARLVDAITNRTIGTEE